MAPSKTKNLKSQYTLEEAAKSLGVDQSEIQEFFEEGLIDWADADLKTIDQYHLGRLRSGISLKKDLGVNLPGIDIILNLREKLQHVEGEFNDFLGSVQRKMDESLDADIEKIRQLKED